MMVWLLSWPLLKFAFKNVFSIKLKKFKLHEDDDVNNGDTVVVVVVVAYCRLQ